MGRKSQPDNVCGIEYSMAVLGKKWTLIILRSLSEGTRRFGQLKRELSAVSTKTLAQRLKDLEKHAIVDRKSYPEIPPRVEYTLTKKGKALEPILRQMKDWGKRFGQAVS